MWLWLNGLFSRFWWDFKTPRVFDSAIVVTATDRYQWNSDIVIVDGVHHYCGNNIDILIYLVIDNFNLKTFEWNWVGYPQIFQHFKSISNRLRFKKIIQFRQ